MSRPGRCSSTWRGHRCNQEAGHAGEHTRDNDPGMFSTPPGIGARIAQEMLSRGPADLLENSTVMGAKARDTWPERQGIPTLERVLESLEFVYHGMSPTSSRQMAALDELMVARQHVEAAIKALKGEG